MTTLKRIALGVVQQRGHRTIKPNLVTFGTAEADFLLRHVTAVRRVTDLSSRSVFTPGSTIPSLLRSLIGAGDALYEEVCQTLQERLANKMKASSNAKDCVFGVAVTQEAGVEDSSITILKLDAVLEAARIDMLQSGEVTLTVLKELIPEPGRLQKAFSWPDERPTSDAITVDINSNVAQYFEAAFDLRVSLRASEAEAELAKALIANVEQARLPEAFAAASEQSGPMDEVLAKVAEGGFPELLAAVSEEATSNRPAGLVRPNKVAIKSIIWRADGIELRVPPNLAGRVTLSENAEGWVLSVRTQAKPEVGQ